jgi:hypothetical protein
VNTAADAPIAVKIRKIRQTNRWAVSFSSMGQNSIRKGTLINYCLFYYPGNGRLNADGGDPCAQKALKPLLRQKKNQVSIFSSN